MKELIENVVQWGKDRGLDKVGHLAQAKYTLKETAELLDAYADQDIEEINDAIGDIAVTLIVGASNDESILSKITNELIKEKFNSPVFDDGTFLTEYSELMYSESSLVSAINIQTLTASHYMNVFMLLNNILGIINHEFYRELSLKDCLQLAYDEIKDRTGKLVDGQFIKD